MHEQRTWLEIQCRRYHDGDGETAVVVLGYDRERYFEMLGIREETPPEFIAIGGCNVRLLHNTSPDLGPFSSLKIACCWILEETDYRAAFVLPIDTPLPSPKVLRALMEEMQPGIEVAQPRHGGRGGHPVLLSRYILSRIAAIDVSDPAARLDAQIHRGREMGIVTSVNVEDHRVLLNLNDPHAWQRYFEEISAQER